MCSPQAVLQRLLEEAGAGEGAAAGRLHAAVLPGALLGFADGVALHLLLHADSADLTDKVKQICSELKCRLVEDEDENVVIKQLRKELDLYYEGSLKQFTVPIHCTGSAYRKEVLAQLQRIPYGATWTYGELARRAGLAAGHARAVGAACGANRHLIVVPCHRVTAAGEPGGYSAGRGRKEWLLAHEVKNN